MFHPTAHIVAIDGARLRFAVEGWKTFTALKFLRRRLEEIAERRWKKPDAELPKRLARWMALFIGGVVGEWEKRKEGG